MKKTKPRVSKKDWMGNLKTMNKLPTAFRLTRLPFIGKYLYRNIFVGDPETRNWIIPVNEVIQRDKSMALPLEVLTPLFQRASYLNCQTYPHGVACIWMGDRVPEMPKYWGEEISYEEALNHARKAIGLGLVPTIVHDSTMVRLLAVCFCCDCCCDIRLGLKVGPRAFWDRVMAPPGVIPVVDENCNLCGACLKRDICHVEAISLGEMKAEIDGDRCVACGRCAEICPSKAISFHLDPEINVVEMLLSNIAERTDITPAASGV
jgi:Pyruvate/2-oxoacid:ferredoxin oxidoreductase delta subunit